MYGGGASKWSLTGPSAECTVMANYDARRTVGAWTEATGDWLRLWTRLTTSVFDTQRAMAAAFGLSATHPDDGTVASAIPSMTYHREDWTYDRNVGSIDEIGVGAAVSFTKRITEADVREFAMASGDTNRLHLDEAFAGETRFGRRIAHGTLVAGHISAALARLPGVTIYLSQDVRYLGPVEIGEEVTAECEVVEDLGDDRYRLTTVVTNEEGRTVIDGEAVVLVDELPAVAAEE